VGDGGANFRLVLLIDSGEVEKLSEVELERRVFGMAPAESATKAGRDCAWTHGRSRATGM
jgi:hypothetical protein